MVSKTVSPCDMGRLVTKTTALSDHGYDGTGKGTSYPQGVNEVL